MHIYYDTRDFRLRNTAVAIGVFDGVHMGHQAVLRQVVSLAQAENSRPHSEPQAEREQWGREPLLAVALTFDVHPAQVLSPLNAPASISTLHQRVALIERMGGGLDALVVEPFTRNFASLFPDEFVDKVLVARLGARHVFIGADFRYGKGRQGTVETLTEAGKRLGFSVIVVPPLTVNGDRVSSTRVRSLVASGDMNAAAALLGHPFAVEGVVVAGKKLGRELGFPTANLEPSEPFQLIPAEGVYAGYAMVGSASLPLPFETPGIETGHVPQTFAAQGNDSTPLPQPLSPPGTGGTRGVIGTESRSYRAAISVGTNPTTDRGDECKIEAYLMDGFDGDLYGQTIELSFHSFLRGQIAFDGLDALKLQMDRDVAKVAELPRPEAKT